MKNISKDILKAIVANKGQLIKELKFFDRRNNGLISRFEVARAFQKCNIHPQLNMDKINNIIKIYANGMDYIDYYKLLTLLIKEIKQILKHTSFCMDRNYNNSLFSSFNNKFLFGPKRLNKSIENKLNYNKTNYNINSLNKRSIRYDIEKENDKIANTVNDFDLDVYNNLKIGTR